MNQVLEPGSAEWLQERGIVYDATGMGRARYTHTKTGRAVVRQPYMWDDEVWKQAKIEFGLKAERGELG
ncbi:MAG: hypothetical protein ABFE07_28265 [Armatimonadia bacterium]